MSGRVRRQQLAILSTLLFCMAKVPSHAATITVTNANNSGPGSLRQALTIANNGTTINFAVTGTITLTSGALPINKNITIPGPGADQLSIDGNQAITVFGVFNGNIATISGLTATNAQSGILNDGMVAVTNSVLSGNLYHGLSNYGVAALSSCVLTDNSYDGLYSYNGVTNVSDCVITGNARGGLFNTGNFGPNNSLAGFRTMTVLDSIISNNSGPGVWNYFGLTIVNPSFTRPPYHDQRGACFYRVFGRRIDVGSVEAQPSPRCVTPAPRPNP